MTYEQWRRFYLSEILILGLFLIWYTCKKATILELEMDCFQESLTLLRKWLWTKLTILKITIVLKNIPVSRLDDMCCPVKLLTKMIFFLNLIECFAFTETAILTDSLERVDCQRFRRGGFYNRGWGTEAKKAGLTGSWGGGTSDALSSYFHLVFQVVW